MLTRSDDSEGGQGGWTRTLWLMVAVQFIISAALAVQGPMLPLFLPEIGVEPGGAIEFWSGVLNSINFLIAAFVSPVWGAIADRYGRKIMVLRSSLAICVFMAFMGLANSLWQLVALRALMGAFSGFSASAIALVATQTPARRFGFALGWLSTGQLLGALLGPVLGGAIADLSGSYRAVFFCTAALAALGVTVTWLFVPEVFAQERGPKRPSFVASLRVVMAVSGLLPLFGVLLMSQFGIRSVYPIVTLFVQELTGPVPMLATLAGFAFAITGVADLLVSPFLGKRSDIIGYRRVLLISLFGAAISTVPQAFVNEYWHFLALRFATGMFIGGILPTANALIGRLVPAASRGLAFGTTASASFLGSFLGPFTGGTVAASLSVRAVFIVTGVLFLLTLVWVYFIVPANVHDEPEEPARAKPLPLSPPDETTEAPGVAADRFEAKAGR